MFVPEFEESLYVYKYETSGDEIFGIKPIYSNYWYGTGWGWYIIF